MAYGQEIEKFQKEDELDLGIGIVIGWPHYGLSVKKWMNEKFAVELISFPTIAGDANSSLHLSGRLLSRLDMDRKNMFSYFAVGIGQFSASASGNQSSSLMLGSILFGIEFSSFYSLEFGLGFISQNNKISGSVTLENGLHYYF